MRHLFTRRTADGVELLYALEGQETFTYLLHRTVLGVSFEEGYAYGCVLGERVFWPPDMQPISRIYIVLDEVEESTPADLFGRLIEVKDKYLCENVYCLNQPQQLVDSLENTEGLTYYGDHSPEVYRELYKSFVDKNTRARFTTFTAPGEKALHQELDYLIQEQALDPATQYPIKDNKGHPISRLSLPPDLSNEKARGAIRQGNSALCVALWCACKGLESYPPRKKTRKPSHQRIPNPITGY